MYHLPAIWTILTLSQNCGTGVAAWQKHFQMMIRGALVDVADVDMADFLDKKFFRVKDFCDIELFSELNHQEYKVNWNIWKESHKVFTEAENRNLMFCVGGQCWHSLASASLLLFLGGVGAVKLSLISRFYLFKYLDITHFLSVVVSNSVSLFWI